MELTHAYKHKTIYTSTGQRSSWQSLLITFVNRYAQVFSALARGGTPYGGNVLSLQPAGTVTNKGNTDQQMMQLQQQLNTLSQTLSRLSDQLDAQVPLEQAEDSRIGSAGTIGINRFRALQTEE